MAVAVIGELPGGNAEMDAQMMQQIGTSPTNPPAGAIARMAGPFEGTYRIMGVWESREAWDTFWRERMEPALRQAGQPMPSFQVWDLDTFFLAQR